eukprot:365303-Chlamydomonas_euryale.AAC.28
MLGLVGEFSGHGGGGSGGGQSVWTVCVWGKAGCAILQILLRGQSATRKFLRPAWTVEGRWGQLLESFRAGGGREWEDPMPGAP